MMFDAIIVGQGLAGSLLAWELLTRRRRVLVIDDGRINASYVAAGLINPVTGQRFVKTRDLDMLLPAAMASYEALSRYFQCNFFKPVDMLRVLRSENERRQALGRFDQPGYRPFLNRYEKSLPGWVAPWGVLHQTATGFLNTRLLLSRLKDYFVERGAYQEAAMIYDDIKVGEILTCREFKTRHLIFCEGYRGIFNPWFSKLPFQPAKGEILHCASDITTPGFIVNYGHWLIPLGDGEFKTGATFDTNALDQQVTPEASERLQRSLAAVCPALAVYRVVEQVAGIRPATLDKQPFVGSHRWQRNLHIFNGFGAKGSLLIPWYAKRFADYLLDGLPLPEHADIDRYDDTYFAA